MLIKIHAMSLNYRDLKIARGAYTGRSPPELVPGADPVGEVVFAGPGAEQWNAGERVTATFWLDDIGTGFTEELFHSGLGGERHGSLQEYRLFPASALVKIPEHLSYEEESTLSCAGALRSRCARHCLTPSARRNDGIYSAVWRSRAAQAGADGRPAGHRWRQHFRSTDRRSRWSARDYDILFRREVGDRAIPRRACTSASVHPQHSHADKRQDVINYKTTPDWEQRVLQLTDGRGAELVIDVGGADTLSKSRQAIKLGGQVVVIGVLSGGDSPPDLLRKVMFRNAIVRGITVGDVVLFKELCASSSCTRSSRSSARFSSSRPRRRRMRAWRSRTS